MELNWSGQFRAETHWIYNYTMDHTADDAAAGANGYSIQGGGGSENAQFQSLFLRLRPSLVVNDNIYIKSEWWLGDPVYGFFGDAAPGSFDRSQYYSTFSDGSVITAQRFWAEFLTDIGTVQVGRAPLHWGLGVLWNSGNDLWDRYQSTGDTVRLVSKFGWFSFVPSVVKYSMGNSVAGSCDNAADGCDLTDIGGPGNVTDYSLMLKYENADQEFDFGLNFIRRVAGNGQDSFSGTSSANTGSMNFTTYDFYTRKRLGDLTLGLEVPVVSGTIGDAEYSTWAAAAEAKWEASSKLELGLQFGHAPGQPNWTGAGGPDKFRAFFFHPSYRLGLIMFNYALHNFHGPNTTNEAGQDQLVSPYDNPIVNANYASLRGGYTFGKWQARTQWTFADSLEEASAGSRFYNYWTRRYGDAVADQDSFLGWEMDYGLSFRWDESFQFHLDFGWFFPGDFFRFANAAGVENGTSPVFGTTFRAGVNF